MKEETLIRAAQEGNLSAFNRLVLEYQGLAYNVAYRVLDDSDAAADATQDSFIKAYRSIKTFRQGSFKAWLLRIVTNTCYDQLRAWKRRPSVSLEDATEDPEYAAWFVQAGENPEHHVMRGELQALIQSGLQYLPEEQRVTLVLADIEGFSYLEIADITGTEVGTIKSRLSRARARLRDYLSRHQDAWGDRRAPAAVGAA